MKLTFAEEILLLTVDDNGTQRMPIPEGTMEYVLIGAVLMDLAFANRIDTDPERLTVINSSPTGVQVLDRPLMKIAVGGVTRDVKGWIASLRDTDAESIRSKAMASLIARGILEQRDQQYLWVFRARRYPVVDGQAEREVKLRISDVLFSDMTPDPRDAALISLADTCGMLQGIFTKREIAQIGDRVRQVRKMDLIGREVAEAVAHLDGKAGTKPAS